MTAPIVLDTNGTRVLAHVHHIGTRGGEPLLAINGALFVMSKVSGWCLDGHHAGCKWRGCGCECHSETVAQTFDEGVENARIAGITQDVKRPDRECANTSTGPTHSLHTQRAGFDE